MLNQTLQIFLAAVLLVCFSPILLVCLLGVYLTDYSSPIYCAKRIGYNGKPFTMYKIRTMVVNQSGKTSLSTKDDDERILTIGRWTRRFKIDEIAQFVNVLTGTMLLVGPRPLPEKDFKKLTNFELQAYKQKPGVTDFSSIFFNNEGSLLKAAKDPDALYNTKIRPWKSRLVIFYMYNASLKTDWFLIFMTGLSLFNRRVTINFLRAYVRRRNASDELLKLFDCETMFQEVLPPKNLQCVFKKVSNSTHKVSTS